MKKAILPILLCGFISTQSFQQSVTVNEPTSFETGNPTNSLISVPDVQQAKASCHGKRIYPKKGGDNGIYLNGKSFSYSAGDTIVLTASQNPYSYVTLEYFTKGTSSCPLVIINEGGQVKLTNYNGDAIPGGFTFFSSQHIKVTGTGSNNKYGFKITTPDNRGVGVDVYGRSAYFEIDHLDIYNKGSGMWIKHEADCADSLSFPNWVLHDFKLHDNYIHNCQQEGMYLGSTDPNGTRVITCNGKSAYPKPMRLGNFHIYNNIFDSTGRGAIQLSDADSGESEINNNAITNIGYEWNIYQGNGIILGGYTHAYVHDNNIDHTYSTGIYSLGAGLVRIVNNTVDHSGMLNGKTANGMASIMIDTRNTTNPSPGQHNPVMLTFKVKSNSLGSNTDYGVRVYNTYLTYKIDNAICNNILLSGKGSATHYVATGIYWKSECDTGVLNKKGYVPSHATTEQFKSLNSVYTYPNPAKDVINVNLNEKISGKITLNIYDVQGRLLQTKSTEKNISQMQQSFNIKALSPGLYTLQIMSSTEKTNLKFIKGE